MNEAHALTLPIDAKTDAEISAERKWGPDWRSKKLDAYFDKLIEKGDLPEIEVKRTTFDWWHALLTVPNREQRCADRLERVNLPIYLPTFTRQTHQRGKLHAPRLYPVMPGMIFAPCEIMETERRDALFEWAGIRDYIRMDGVPARASKADIELIRIIEAKLNLPPEAKGVLFKVGQKVHFLNELLGAFWGGGKIFEIASETRVGVEVDKLFGRTAKVYVPAAEIEAI
jgi:transcription antitermination factor NusG